MNSSNPLQRPLRILYHHRTLADGAEGIHIRELIRAFRDLGHTVKVVALVGDEAPVAASSDDAERESFRQRLLSNFSRWLPTVFYELAEIGYNTVGRSRLLRAIDQFKPDLIYDRYNSFCNAAVSAGRRRGVPVFVEVNAPLVYERTQHDGRPLRLKRLARCYENHVVDSANHVFAVSTPLKQHLISEYALPPEQVTVLPNGVDANHFDPQENGDEVRKRFELCQKQVIGFVGILRPWHGLEMLLDVFEDIVSEVPEAHLLIVGDGPSESSLKAHVQSTGLSGHVTFTGRIQHGNMGRYLASMNIAVSPRTTFYASPMKILEYMAMGIPTVAPDSDNILDILANQVDGLTFPKDDQAALKQALLSLLRDPELAKRLGANARKKVEQKMTWNHVAQRVIDHFAAAMSDRESGDGSQR